MVLLNVISANFERRLMSYTLQMSHASAYIVVIAVCCFNAFHTLSLSTSGLWGASVPEARYIVDRSPAHRHVTQEQLMQRTEHAHCCISN